VSIIGVNTETLESNTIISGNPGLGFPNYSVTDGTLIYDVPFRQNGNITGYDWGFVGLNEDKISATGPGQTILEFRRWPVWFSNGTRILSDVIDLGEGDVEIEIFPNPSQDLLFVGFDKEQKDLQIQLSNMDGKQLHNQIFNGLNLQLDISSYPVGTYILSVISKDNIFSQQILKID